MIKNTYRLNENEVKKVLKFGKPFFSYGVVLNKIKSKLSYNRFGIVIGAKSVTNNITRNYFRRKFYNLVSALIDVKGDQAYDLVFIVKKSLKLDKKESSSIFSFKKDMNFLINKNK